MTSNLIPSIPSPSGLTDGIPGQFEYKDPHDVKMEKDANSTQSFNLKGVMSTLVFVFSLIAFIITIIALISLYFNNQKRQQAPEHIMVTPNVNSKNNVVIEDDVLADLELIKTVNQVTENKEVVSRLPNGEMVEDYLKKQKQVLLNSEREIFMRGDVSLNGEVTFGSWNKKGSQFLKDTDFQIGSYELRYMNERETLLYTIFMADFYFPLGKHFEYFIPVIDGMSKIILVKDEVVLAEKVISPNIPIITMPITPAFDSDGKLTFNFTATDADGDDLTYSIYYSEDGWKTYKSLVLDINNTTYQVSADVFTSGNTYQFKVYTSDGFNTSYVKVDAVTVPIR